MSNLSDTKRFDPSVWRGAWVAGTYSANSMVSYNGLAYVSKNNTATIPTDSSQWDVAHVTPSSLLYFTESLSIPAPVVVDINGNYVSGIDDHPSCQITPKYAPEADVHLVLKPKGSGSLMASVPDQTPVGGNVRGQACVDLQLSREIATEVASATYATLLGGRSNTASGTGSACIGGYKNIASGASSTCFGEYNLANGTRSLVIGKNGTARTLANAFVHSSSSMLSNAVGASQAMQLIYHSGNSMVTNVSRELTIGGDAVTTFDTYLPPIGLTQFSGEFMTKGNSPVSPYGEVFSRWSFSGMILKTGPTPASTTIHGLTFRYPETTGETSIITNQVCLAISIDPSNGRLKFMAQTANGGTYTYYTGRLNTLEMAP
jgi:hypothetical protein